MEGVSMRSYLYMCLVAAPVFAACAIQSPGLPQDPVTPPPDEVSAAEQFFNDNVMPALELNCASCHAAPGSMGAPLILGAGPDEYYDTLTLRDDFVSCDVDRSLLLLKGADPTHPGVPFPIADTPNVHEWLMKEAEARNCPPPGSGNGSGSGSGSGSGGAGTGGGGTGGEGGAPPVDPTELSPMQHLQLFGACMQFTQWVETGMPLVANTNAQYNGNNTQCYGCHSGPDVGLNQMPQPGNDPANNEAVQQAFTNMRVPYALLNLAAWSVDQNGKFLDIVPSYAWRDTGQYLTHPPYDLNQESIASLESWFDLSYANYMNSLQTGIPCNPADGAPP
jgi:hypothetical protein